MGRRFAQGVPLRSGGAGFTSGVQEHDENPSRLLDSSTSRLRVSSPTHRLPDSIVDNCGEKWGQVALAVDKWHNASIPDTRSPRRPGPRPGATVDAV